MSMTSPTNVSVLTLRHSGGSVNLKVTIDHPIAELIPDFLDITGQPDRDGWVLGPVGGDPYPGEMTLAELGVSDETVLVLHDLAAPISGSGQSQPAVAPVLRSRRNRRRADRPLSALTAQTLPARLPASARAWSAIRATLICTPRDVGSERYGSSVLDPAAFTRPTRTSPAAQVREAWASSSYEQLLDRMILGLRLRRCVTIAVVSPKGGVGKSTITALLGSLLAFLRRDRVVAVETNPDWGSLGRRLVPDHPVFIDELLAGPLRDGKLSPTHLDALLGRGPDGLMVAPAPTQPERAEKLDEAAYRILFNRLCELVGTLVLDCGTGLDDPPARAALGCADQLVLVCDDEPDTASIVSEAAEWLHRFAPPLVLVVNNLRRASRINIAALEREMAELARGIAIVPRDERAAVRLHGSRFSWKEAPGGWQRPVRELTALLAAD